MWDPRLREHRPQDAGCGARHGAEAQLHPGWRGSGRSHPGLWTTGPAGWMPLPAPWPLWARKIPQDRDSLAGPRGLCQGPPGTGSLSWPARPRGFSPVSAAPGLPSPGRRLRSLWLLSRRRRAWVGQAASEPLASRFALSVGVAQHIGEKFPSKPLVLKGGVPSIPRCRSHKGRRALPPRLFPFSDERDLWPGFVFAGEARRSPAVTAGSLLPGWLGGWRRRAPAPGTQKVVPGRRRSERLISTPRGLQADPLGCGTRGSGLSRETREQWGRGGLVANRADHAAQTVGGTVPSSFWGPQLPVHSCPRETPSPGSSETQVVGATDASSMEFRL